MNNILYLSAVVLIIIWVTGYYIYHAGNMIHVILPIAMAAILLRVIRDKSPI